MAKGNVDSENTAFQNKVQVVQFPRSITVTMPQLRRHAAQTLCMFRRASKAVLS